MRFTPLLIVVLAAACAGSPPATPAGAPSPPSLVASPPAITPAGPADWRPLADGLWLPETPFAVAFAANRSDFDALLARLGQAGPPPAVDFASEVALFMGMSGSSSCPERLERVVVDHAAARAHWP